MKRFIVLLICMMFGLSGCMNNESADMEREANEDSGIIEVDEQENSVVEDREDDTNLFQWTQYAVDINEPKMMDQISYISGSITIPIGDEVTILDHA